MSALEDLVEFAKEGLEMIREMEMDNPDESE